MASNWHLGSEKVPEKNGRKCHAFLQTATKGAGYPIKKIPPVRAGTPSPARIRLRRFMGCGRGKPGKGTTSVRNLLLLMQDLA